MDGTTGVHFCRGDGGTIFLFEIFIFIFRHRWLEVLYKQYDRDSERKTDNNIISIVYFSFLFTENRAT